MVTTMAFLQYYLKSSTKRGWEMSSLLVAIHVWLYKIAKKFFPDHILAILINFRTLSNEYGQFASMKSFNCIDGEKKPIPWYTYPAIEYLKNIDFSNKKIFEYGSGNSSIWWSERCNKLISIESDPIWKNKISALLNNSKFDYRLATDETSYIKHSDIASCNVIIIDGQFRAKCADFILSEVGSGSTSLDMLIFDNSDWYPHTISKLNETLTNWVQVDFSGFGPINSYTWTTSIFLNMSSGSKLVYKASLTSIAGIPIIADDD
jgi:hypothetical protein